MEIVYESVLPGEEPFDSQTPRWSLVAANMAYRPNDLDVEKMSCAFAEVPHPVTGHCFVSSG